MLLVAGFWAINKIHKKNGLIDYQWIGIDEVVGMWIANMFLFELDFTFARAVVFSIVSFSIFRVIDIIKFIPPLKIVNENKNQTAMAVLMDDIIAGFYTYFVMMAIFQIYNADFLYFSLLMLLPAMIANMTPVLLKIKYWNVPINESIFGKNKTWRGFLGAILVGTLTYFLMVKYSVITHSDTLGNSLGSILLIGFLFSFGAIGGDLVKSFFKRKRGIESGVSFMPWDQIDYILGMIMLTYFVYYYSFSQMVFMLVLGGSISALFHRIGYMLKMNSDKQ